MQVSVVELPPPPRQYPALPAGAEKKMLEGDWEDTNDVDGGEVPPPPYVARLSMYGGAPTDEKAALRPRPRRNESEDGQPIIEESEANRGEDEDKDEDGEDIYRSRPRRRRSSTPRRIVPPNELDRQLAGRGSDDEDEEEEREEKIVATVSDLEADPGTGTFGPTGSSRPDHGNNNSRALYVARRSTTVKRGPGTKRPSSMSGPPVSRTSTLGKHSRNRLSQSHQAPEVNESNLPPLDRSIFRDAEDSDLRSLYLKHLQQERRLFAEYQKIIAIEQKIWEEERKRSNEIIQKLQAKVKNLLEKGSQNPEEGTFGQGMDYHRMRAYQQELQNQHHRNNGKQRAIEGYPDSHLHQHQHPHMHNHNLNHTFSPVSATTPIDHTTWEVGTMGAYRPRGQVSSYMSHNPQDYNSYSSSTSGGTLNSAFNPPQSATSSTSGFSFSSSAAPNNSSQRQYWADFLDDNRLSSRCATIPQIGASSSSNGLQHHQHHPLLYGERGGGDGADGLGLGKEAVVREDEEMRTRQPIKEERAVYARMYAEASIGIGGPSSELL